jgi:hypothetical protein
MAWRPYRPLTFADRTASHQPRNHPRHQSLGAVALDNSALSSALRGRCSDRKSACSISKARTLALAHYGAGMDAEIPIMLPNLWLLAASFLAVVSTPL